MQFKPQIRILGIDDSPFSKLDHRAQVLVVAPVFRGGQYMDGLLSTTVTADGLDATKHLINMINKSRNKEQLKLIMLDGIALGGFNIVDIQELHKRTTLPVIVVIRHKPDIEAIKKALKNLPNRVQREQLLKKAGPIHTYSVEHPELGYRGKSIQFQFTGLTESEVRQVLKMTIRHGLIPEPIRVAHLIGQGIILGESKGRA